MCPSETLKQTNSETRPERGNQSTGELPEAGEFLGKEIRVELRGVNFSRGNRDRPSDPNQDGGYVTVSKRLENLSCVSGVRVHRPYVTHELCVVVRTPSKIFNRLHLEV